MRTPPRTVALAAGLGLLAASGCDEGASPNAGVGALLRLTNAQYVAGELSTQTTADAPTMQGITIGNTTVFPGATGRALSGSANAATGVLIGLQGDDAHWLVPTGVPDNQNPGAFTFATSFSLAPQTPLDPAMRSLFFRAVNDKGTVGPPMAFNLKIQALTLSSVPSTLQISLTWDTDADLDLKVRVPVPNPAPMGKPYVDVWNRSPTALPPLPRGAAPYTAADIAAAGKLDFDSNAQCVIDGRLQENVIFTESPPPGQYEVRVDTYSMCGQVAAQWQVVVTADGQMVAQAYGQAGDVDTRGSHGSAAGTLALTFTVPSP
jgi:hypothetical protein